MGKDKGAILIADHQIQQPIPIEVSAYQLPSNASLIIDLMRNVFDLAILAYDKATAKDPSDYLTWIELSAANLGARKGQESVNALAQAVQTGGESAREILRKDPRFNAIRQSPAFQTLVPAKAAARSTSGLNFPFGGGAPRP